MSLIHFFRWRRSDIRSSLAKAFTEQFAFDPFSISLFLYSMSIFEGKTPEQARNEVSLQENVSFINQFSSIIFAFFLFRCTKSLFLSTQLDSFIGQLHRQSILLGWSSAIRLFMFPSHHSFGRPSWLIWRLEKKSYKIHRRKLILFCYSRLIPLKKVRPLSLLLS